MYEYPGTQLTESMEYFKRIAYGTTDLELIKEIRFKYDSVNLLMMRDRA